MTRLGIILERITDFSRFLFRLGASLTRERQRGDGLAFTVRCLWLHIAYLLTKPLSLDEVVHMDTSYTVRSYPRGDTMHVFDNIDARLLSGPITAGTSCYIRKHVESPGYLLIV